MLSTLKKFILELSFEEIVRKNCPKIPFTNTSTAPNLLPMKITKKTQNFQKNTRELKGAAFFLKERDYHNRMSTV